MDSGKYPGEIIALIGPSGTGKSQRAVMVASELDTPYMIDDGLFIRGSKIVAGRSAKAEKTRIAAVRRAIFSDPEHAAEVQAALHREQPKRLLILSTSRGMVSRIVQSLSLPEPSTVLRIEDVASREEIEAAQRSRKGLGHHVIPVPTLEVTRTLTGYLINPLRLLYQGGMFRRPMIIEKTVVRPTFSSLGNFYISDRVITAIASRALAEINGFDILVPPVTRVQEGRVSVSFACEVPLNGRLMETLTKAQWHVKRTLEYCTALEVDAVNINVVSVR